jgi:hypothetical protein
MIHYHLIGCQVLWREFCYYAALSEAHFTFDFLKQGLHNTPEQLRECLQAAVNKVDEEKCDAILLGYGLCSNGLAGIKAGKHRLVAPKAHDCITFFLGTKERYREYFDKHPGTYWYTPGWIECSLQPGKERYDFLLKQYVEKYGEDNGAYLLEMEQGWLKEYNNVAYVDLGFGNNRRYQEYSAECAQWLGWRIDHLDGDPSLIKNLLAGRWDPDQFLIVEPGQMIMPSHDDRVITVASV